MFESENCGVCIGPSLLDNEDTYEDGARNNNSCVSSIDCVKISAVVNVVYTWNGGILSLPIE